MTLPTTIESPKSEEVVEEEVTWDNIRSFYSSETLDTEKGLKAFKKVLTNNQTLAQQIATNMELYYNKSGYENFTQNINSLSGKVTTSTLDEILFPSEFLDEIKKWEKNKKLLFLGTYYRTGLTNLTPEQMKTLTESLEEKDLLALKALYDDTYGITNYIINAR
jgi:hypothetical protein